MAHIVARSPVLIGSLRGILLRMFLATMGFLAAVMLVSGLRPLALYLSLVDRPGGRKDHDGETPLVGGLAMFGGFFLVSFLQDPLPAGISAMAIGSLILVMTGSIDDRWELPTASRFAAQTAAVMVMVSMGGTALHDLGDLLFFGTISLGLLAIPFTVFATVGAINAMNMVDGLDGLAGGLALITIGALAWVSWSAGLELEFYLLLILACVILGFLVFNLRTPWQSKAKIFMGDAGSMFLGFIMTWFMVRLSQGETRAMAPVTALWIFALPLMDTIDVMLRRILNGGSPFKADRKHLHYVLLGAGLSVPQTVGLMLSFSGLTAVAGLSGHYAGLSDGTLFVGFGGLFTAYFLGKERIDVLIAVLRRLKAKWRLSVLGGY